MPQLTLNEQDEVLKLAAQSKKPSFSHAEIAALCRRRRADPVYITTIRRFMRGKTDRRGAVETRGRKRCWSRANVMTANRVRKDKIKKHPGKYIKWDRIVKASRAPQVHPATAQRSFKREGLPVTFRHCREKLELKPEHEEEHETICGVLSKKPVEYFEDEVDMIMDCKMFPTPTTQKGREYAQRQRKTGNLRLPGEGHVAKRIVRAC